MPPLRGNPALKNPFVESEAHSPMKYIFLIRSGTIPCSTACSELETVVIKLAKRGSPPLLVIDIREFGGMTATARRTSKQ